MNRPLTSRHVSGLGRFRDRDHQRLNKATGYDDERQHGWSATRAGFPAARVLGGVRGMDRRRPVGAGTRRSPSRARQRFRDHRGRKCTTRDFGLDVDEVRGRPQDEISLALDRGLRVANERSRGGIDSVFCQHEPGISLSDRALSDGILRRLGWPVYEAIWAN